nr:retrovirus-related Pol polyprotein from transposon TNT 1-94 [Tanacetum cinerariifolium]
MKAYKKKKARESRKRRESSERANAGVNALKPTKAREYEACENQMAEDSKIKVDKFDGSDYGFWKMQIEDLLYQKSLHLPMLGEQPDDMYDEEWKLLDKQALGVVRLSLAKSVTYNIVNETTTYGVLKALSNMYEKPSASNKVFLIRQLVNTKMKEGMPVAVHINEFNSIISRLSSVEIKFEDEVQALLLLSSLPDSWSGTVTAVSSASGTTKLTFDSIRDLILNKDIRRRRSSGESSSSSSLLHTESRGRRNDRGHNRGRSNSRRRGQSKNRKDIECWNCKEKGHFRNQCPKPKAEKKEVNDVYSEESGDFLICCVENSEEESWIMDSGASFHAVSYPDMVKNLQSGNLGKVSLADDQVLDITVFFHLE